MFIGIPRGEELFLSLHPLFTPRNADKHRGFGAFGEEYLAESLYENKIKEVSITVPVKQPTSHSCASRLFAFCQLAISGSRINHRKYLR